MNTFADRTRRRTSRPACESLEERGLLSTITGVTEFPTPTPQADPVAIVKGPDGNLWFTEEGPNSAIGMLNPKTDKITEFVVSTAVLDLNSLTVGSDGNIWFAESVYNVDKIGMINPTTHAIAQFSTPGISPNGITTGSDGNLWITGSGKIESFNPTTRAINVYTPNPTRFPNPSQITTGPDGNLWFTSVGEPWVGELNPKTGVFQSFKVSKGASGAATLGRIAAGPDGNLWFDDYTNDDMDTINPTTDVITKYQLPSQIYGQAWIVAGPDGNVWFTGQPRKISSINPTTHAITEYTLPTGDYAYAMTVGPDGNLWFTDETNNSAIGVAYLSSTNTALVQNRSASTVTATAGPATLEFLPPGPFDSSLNDVTAPASSTSHKIRVPIV